MPADDLLIGDSKPRILVVDDERSIRDILSEYLELEGFFVRAAEDGRKAVAELRLTSFDVVISDLKMPNMGGLELLKEVGKLQPQAETIMMTGFGTVETAINAMKLGAYDYVLKPFKVSEILHVVRRALQKQRLEAENLRLREAVSLYKVSEAISASLSLDEVVKTLSETSLVELRSDAAIVWVDDGQGHFTCRSAVTAAPHGERNDGDAPSSTEAPSSAAVPIGDLDGEAVQKRLESEPFIVAHGEEATRMMTDPTAPIASLIVIALRTQQKLIGWVAAVSRMQGHRFDEGQRKLLSIVASRASAAIENGRLYEDLQATFQQTIRSLARTIDKMDAYTAGHSERVSQYAARLAMWLGLPPEKIEIVRQAALMHDIGKVGCVLKLNKPGRLTDEEFGEFRQHPGYGRDILDPIKFLQPVIPGVYSHHERWDGKGYPLGLKAQEIPLIARIISVADTYDAMTSNRAYRRAMPHAVSIEEITRCSGSQFDADVAGTFTEKIEIYRDERRAIGQDVPE
jgi:response regulator RpfG family c-di-GMP phosphodiesterase